MDERRHSCAHLPYGERDFTCYRDLISEHCAGLDKRRALLFYRTFPRLPMVTEMVLVLHPLSPKDAEVKRAAMRQHGAAPWIR